MTAADGTPAPTGSTGLQQCQRCTDPVPGTDDRRIDIDSMSGAHAAMYLCQRCMPARLAEPAPTAVPARLTRSRSGRRI